jgi:hypothetical protein
MLHVSTELCKEARPQCVYVSVRKTACIEDDRLATDGRSANSGMDSVDCHDILQGPLVGLVRFSCHIAALLPQLQLRHHWLGDLHSHVLQFVSLGEVAPIVKTF